VFSWLYLLQEAPEYKYKVKKRYNLTVEGLATLRLLNHQISCVVDFWVQIVLEGYIINFVVKNYQAFSKSKEIFREGSRGIVL